MNEPGENLPRPNYKWPWFVLAAVLLMVVLSVVWMRHAIQQERQQRDFSSPLPGSTPSH